MTDEASTILLDLQTIIRGMTRFSAHTEWVTDGDYRVLDMGVDEAAVLTVGPFDQEGEGQNREAWTHTILIDLFERDQSDGQAWSKFRALRGDVLETLRQYPQLNDGTLFVEGYDLSSENDPERITGTGSFCHQTIRARYTLGIAVTGGDYA